jgi:hypothetical protein
LRNGCNLSAKLTNRQKERNSNPPAPYYMSNMAWANHANSPKVVSLIRDELVLWNMAWVKIPSVLGWNACCILFLVTCALPLFLHPFLFVTKPST